MNFVGKSEIARIMNMGEFVCFCFMEKQKMRWNCLEEYVKACVFFYFGFYKAELENTSVAVIKTKFKANND